MIWLDDWVGMCIAHCLDLVGVSLEAKRQDTKNSEKCEYNTKSGLGKQLRFIKQSDTIPSVCTQQLQGLVPRNFIQILITTRKLTATLQTFTSIF